MTGAQISGSPRCREAQRAISHALDGGLSRSEKRFLRAHLCTCADCSLLAERMWALRRALKKLWV